MSEPEKCGTMVYFPFYCCDKHTPKPAWGQMFYLVYMSQVTLHYWGKLGQEFKQSRNLKVETEVEAMELLTGLFPIAPSVFSFYTASSSFPGVASLPVGWDPPCQSSIKKMPYKTHVMEAFSQMVSFS